jgi:hypothetical protein
LDQVADGLISEILCNCRLWNLMVKREPEGLNQTDLAREVRGRRTENRK